MNAKDEFKRHTKDAGAAVKCAHVKIDRSAYDDMSNAHLLREGYKQADYDAFLALLDVEYDDGYGGQQLYGTIWYENGTWSTRGEYDGSEWWEHHKVPGLPEYLKKPRTEKIADFLEIA